MRHQPGPDGLRRSHPQNAVQHRGGVVDVWYLDDGTAIMVPELAVHYLQAYDRITASQGGKRNFKKTVVTIYANEAERSHMQRSWQLDLL
eukprot:12323109-Karenia_brevis.AAC.1